MRITSFLGSLRDLKWGTAIDNVTYVRAVSCLMWVMMLAGLLVSLLTVFVGILGGGKKSMWIVLLLWLPVVLWFFWQSLKLANNRVHDLGFQSRYYWLFVVFSVIVQSWVGLTLQDSSVFETFVAATCAIIAVPIFYYMWVEKGPAKIPYKRATLFGKTPISFIEKVGITVVGLLCVASLIVQISKFI